MTDDRIFPTVGTAVTGYLEATGQAWTDWDAPATRGWTARLLWQALDSYFGQDTLP